MNILNIKKLFFVFLALIVLVVLLGGTTFYFYKKSKSSANPALTAQNEAKALATKVGKLILLPQDEIPTIATVSDPEALKDQVFFKDAKKGYKVLIYSNAGKAVLYDPDANKVINMSVVDFGKAQKPVQAPPEAKATEPKAAN